jgi:hypothetical protein
MTLIRHRPFKAIEKSKEKLSPLRARKSNSWKSKELIPRMKEERLRTITLQKQ